MDIKRAEKLFFFYVLKESCWVGTVIV